MRRAFFALFAAVAAVALLSGCSFPDGLRIRDDYMGRSIADRNIIVKPVPRDAYGNPILPGN